LIFAWLLAPGWSYAAICSFNKNHLSLLQRHGPRTKVHKYPPAQAKKRDGKYSDNKGDMYGKWYIECSGQKNITNSMRQSCGRSHGIVKACTDGLSNQLLAKTAYINQI
jgi:hypothetical protein